MVLPGPLGSEYFWDQQLPLVYTHHVCTLGTKEGEKRVRGRGGGGGGEGQAELKVTVTYGV